VWPENQNDIIVNQEDAGLFFHLPIQSQRQNMQITDVYKQVEEFISEYQVNCFECIPDLITHEQFLLHVWHPMCQMKAMMQYQMNSFLFSSWRNQIWVSKYIHDMMLDYNFVPVFLKWRCNIARLRGLAYTKAGSFECKDDTKQKIDIFEPDFHKQFKHLQHRKWNHKLEWGQMIPNQVIIHYLYENPLVDANKMTPINTFRVMSCCYFIIIKWYLSQVMAKMDILYGYLEYGLGYSIYNFIRDNVLKPGQKQIHDHMIVLINNAPISSFENDSKFQMVCIGSVMDPYYNVNHIIISYYIPYYTEKIFNIPVYYSNSFEQKLNKVYCRLHRELKNNQKELPRIEVHKAIWSPSMLHTGWIVVNSMYMMRSAWVDSFYRLLKSSQFGSHKSKVNVKSKQERKERQQDIGYQELTDLVNDVMVQMDMGDFKPIHMNICMEKSCDELYDMFIENQEHQEQHQKYKQDIEESEHFIFLPGFAKNFHVAYDANLHA
jgi:hypothetical protein